MIAKRIKRLVVTDLDNHLLGMVSRERILHMLVS
jgi:predicted transcriptional regulator